MSAASKHRVYFLIQKVAHRLKKYADQCALDAGGMTTAQAAVLNIIISEGSANQAHIAKTLSQRESAITTMAKRLEDAGYITKMRSDEDRRVWQLKSTPKGRAAYKAMSTALRDVNALLDGAITHRRMDSLVRSLEATLDRLDDPES